MLGPVSDSPGPHVLFCAFAEVPGTCAAGTRTAQWLSVFGGKDVDALSLKGPGGAHIQRLGGARMMRVPNTLGKPFLQRISTYQRALQRQLAGDTYDLVWCADLFSAAIVAPTVKDGPPLIMEIDEVPSQRTRSLLGDDPTLQKDLTKKWREQERLAIRAAQRIILPSRNAARLLSERIDPRFLLVVPRAVDRSVFSPPSVEVALDDEHLVLVFGGREGGPLLAAAVAIAEALAATLPPPARIGIVGKPQRLEPNPVDGELRALLARKDLADRVELVDAEDCPAAAAALSQADVVVVPSVAEDDAEPFALPHRALEAMSCGRAVVVTGHEASFRDFATPGEHFLVTPPRDPRAAAAAVAGLLADATRRQQLRRAAARFVERNAEITTRAQELHQAIADATGVRLRLHPPRGDDGDSSSQSAPVRAAPKPSAKEPLVDSGPFARMPPPPPLKPKDSAARAPGNAPGIAPLATMRMDLPPLGSVDGAGEPGGMWEGDTFLDGALPPTFATAPDASRVKAAMLLSSDASHGAASGIDAITDPSLELPAEAAADHEDAHTDDEPSREAPRDASLASEDSEEDEEDEEGDEPLDEVSAEALEPADTTAASDDDENSESDDDDGGGAFARRRDARPRPKGSQPSSVPTSLMVEAEILDESRSTGDPWAPDTIADGMPVDARLGEVSLPRTSTKKSFLVDVDGAAGPPPREDLTMEDGAVPSSDDG